MASTSSLPQLTEGVFAHKIDHYAILGAPLFANQEDVKQAYHRTAMALRSGLVERSAAGDQATQILAKMVNPAKQILLKTADKTEYDTTLQLLGKKLSQEQPSLLRLVSPSPEIFRLIESARLQEDYTRLITALSTRTYTSLDQCGQVIHLLSQINLAYLLLSSDSGGVYRASRPLISTHSQQNSLPGPELRQEAEAYAQQAEKLIQQQQLQAALKSLNLAIRKDSTCIDFYLQRAFVQRQLGDLESARADYEQAIHLEPRHREARQGLQDILAALSAQFTQKIDTRRTTTASTPLPRSQEQPAVSPASSSPPVDFHKEARKRFQEAERLIKRGLDQEAVYHLSIAIARDPRPEYYLLRARLNRKQDYQERAQADYDQVLRLDPDHPEALKELQQLRPTPAPQSHPREEARKRYRQALELIDQELYEAAVQNLTSAISKDLNQVSYYLTRARVYRLMQEIDLARGDYDQVIQMDPRNQEALQGLQEILQLSVTSRTRSSQSPPPPRRPTLPPEEIAAQLFQQAQELMGTRQEPKAVLLLSQAINADPHNIEYHLARARLCRKLGNLETLERITITLSF
ncbi:MAG: hypothetical protein HC921_19135 [Synechococcaceae cyanobacterium SM2_3_1]|nr:hypothetical protein [Synechococcaceae cyanobacterium SM2_3_1]